MSRKLLSMVVVCGLLVSMLSTTARAEMYYEDYITPQVVRCTCYCEHGYTKSGHYTRDGIVAGKEEWLGKVAVLYEMNKDGSMGQMIGIYEVLDTGGAERLKNGTSVDVWQPTLESCYDWVGEYGDYVYLQLVDGRG